MPFLFTRLYAQNEGHIYKLDEEHSLDMLCQCGPEYRCLCPSCEGEGCWRCSVVGPTHGTVQIGVEEAYRIREFLLIIHKEKNESP
jgi:hypothetical protein